MKRRGNLTVPLWKSGFCRDVQPSPFRGVVRSALRFSQGRAKKGTHHPTAVEQYEGDPRRCAFWPWGPREGAEQATAAERAALEKPIPDEDAAKVALLGKVLGSMVLEHLRFYLGTRPAP